MEVCVKIGDLEMLSGEMEGRLYTSGDLSDKSFFSDLSKISMARQCL